MIKAGCALLSRPTALLWGGNRSQIRFKFVVSQPGAFENMI
jgi:hypothetical protein